MARSDTSAYTSSTTLSHWRMRNYIEGLARRQAFEGKNWPTLPLSSLAWVVHYFFTNFFSRTQETK